MIFKWIEKMCFCSLIQEERIMKIMEMIPETEAETLALGSLRNQIFYNHMPLYQGVVTNGNKVVSLNFSYSESPEVLKLKDYNNIPIDIFKENSFEINSRRSDLKELIKNESKNC